jgi:phytoene dehydrogenase-like protein
LFMSLFSQNLCMAVFPLRCTVPWEEIGKLEAMIDAVVVGAGLSGLACARELHAKNFSVLVLEASDGTGGRVRTDASGGFLLDRGFQVLLTAYSEAQRQLDFGKLELRNFEPGALVRHGRKFHHVSDPFRRPSQALGTLLDSTLTVRDKYEVARLRMTLAGLAPEKLFRGEQEDTLNFLRRRGFSERGIQRFFVPFFGGVFSDTSLRASNRFFKYLFQCFSAGDTAVPAHGMQAIPAQMTAGLPHLRVLLNSMATRVQKIAPAKYAVDTAMRQTVETRSVVIATDATAAQRLLAPFGADAKQSTAVAWNGVTTLYYAAPKAPVEERLILLNGEGSSGGPINHAAVMTNLAAAYAPAGAHLICANVPGKAPQNESERASLEQDVRTQLRRWFGQQLGQWEVVGGYFLPQAVPLQRYAEWEQGPVSVKTVAKGRSKKDEGQEIFICGDYCETASIQGALVSGRRTAEAVAAMLQRG